MSETCPICFSKRLEETKREPAGPPFGAGWVLVTFTCQDCGHEKSKIAVEDTYE